MYGYRNAYLHGEVEDAGFPIEYTENSPRLMDNELAEFNPAVCIATMKR